MRASSRIFLLLLFIFPLTVLSQEFKGKVLSEKGEPAIGVTVHFQNKGNAVITKTDGTFKLMATKLPDTLMFSAPGYESYKVVITAKNIKDTNFEVVLLNSRKMLKETASLKYEAMGSVYKITNYSKPMYFGDTNIIISREGILAKSRVLTAGEVNDFNKWKMWEDFTEDEFKQHSVFWRITPKRRYSVQLIDKNRNAVINEQVYLISSVTRDTVWKAYTDNTGKAELWSGFFKDVAGNDDYVITDRFGNTITHPSQFENGINFLSVDKPCNISSDVDIAFVVDATGSMGDEIEFLKLELEDVIRNTMDKYSSLSLRAASVFYRDERDEYLAKKTSFHDDLLKTLNFIKLQRASGGGDYAEAVDDALSMALDSMDWNPNARARLLFLILDAPPHDEDRTRIQHLIVKAAALGIRIIPLGCSGTDKSTEFLLRSMALATNGTYTFLTDNSGIGNDHIEPTTDRYENELLNSLLQRIIGQFLYAKDCSPNMQTQLQPIRQPGNILSLKIYPNPVRAQFTIETKKELKEIFITDFTGKILMRLPAADKKGRWLVNIGNYPSGNYLVKYITIDNKWGAEKITLVR